jgi:hypothetical protein
MKCPHPPFNWKALNRAVQPVVNYLSDAENLAGLGQIAATAGIIAFCAGTVGVGCVAAVGAYAAFTGVKVIYGDSTHERWFHAGSALIGVIPAGRPVTLTLAGFSGALDSVGDPKPAEAPGTSPQNEALKGLEIFLGQR